MARTVILGLMTHHVSSPERYSRHARAAFAEGFHGVAVFEPARVDLKRRSIYGFLCVRGGRWQRQSFPLPSICMDIGYYTSPKGIHDALRAKNQPALMNFTGYGLGNKWTIQKHLLRSKLLLNHLLPTQPARSVHEVLAFADQQKSLMLKPINGKGGQGIVRLSAPVAGQTGRSALRRGSEPYLVRNNDRLFAYRSRAGAGVFVRSVLSRGTHLMQRWIDIRNRQGCVYDIRALVQKNGGGSWQLTGLAVREGQRDKITSNLKTGGHAYEASAYLKQQFGDALGEQLTLTAHRLAALIPHFLEQSYGIRLSELGIDLAVDREGHMWLLEVNIKPGRQVIQQVYGAKAYEESFRLPFRYARHLLHGGSDSPPPAELAEELFPLIELNVPDIPLDVVDEPH